MLPTGGPAVARPPGMRSLRLPMIFFAMVIIIPDFKFLKLEAHV